MQAINEAMCPSCNQRFVDFKSLATHIQRDCKKFLRRFECSDNVRHCNPTMYWETVLLHLGKCSDFRSCKPVTCCVCNKSMPAYEYPLHLQKDILTTCIQLTTSVFKCDICDLDLPTMSLMQDHKDLHTKYTEDKLKFSPETLNQDSDIRAPQRKRRRTLHNNDRGAVGDSSQPDMDQPTVMGSHFSKNVFPCDLCQFVANSYDELISHLDDIHETKPEVTWKTKDYGTCYKCMRSFKSPALAIIHLEHCGRRNE